jgi:hypothetical protein
VSDEGFRFEVSRFICASQKNNNPDHLMAGRIEGHFMVHRTDGAGGCMGQVGSGNAAICRRAERSFLRTYLSPAALPISCAVGNSGCRLLMTAVRAVRAIYPKPLTR